MYGKYNPTSVYKATTAAITMLLWLQFIPLQLVSQNSDQPYSMVFEKQLRFSLSPIVYNKLQLQHEGEVLLGSRNTISWEAGIHYYQSIGNTMGVNMGFGWGMVPSNLNFHFYADVPYLTNDSPHELNHYEYFIHSLVFPISFQKIFIKSEKLFYSVELGARLNRIHRFEIGLGVGYNISDSIVSLRLFDSLLENFGPMYPRKFLSYNMKIGLIKPTRKLNAFHCNLVANYSPRKIGGGWYKFSNLPYESYGTMELGINYVGIEVAYGLTFAKRPVFQSNPRN